MEKASTRVRLSHIHEKNDKRIITIAYKFNKSEGEVTYAATIFRKIKNSESWDRKGHNKTAISRLEKTPITIFIPIPSDGGDSDIKFVDIELMIRKYLFLFGVQTLQHVIFTSTITAPNKRLVYDQLLKIIGKTGQIRLGNSGIQKGTHLKEFGWVTQSYLICK